MPRHHLSAAVAGLLALMSTQALAHPGHDHAHWSSPALHGMFLFTLLAAAGIGSWWVLRMRQRRNAEFRAEHRSEDD